MTTHQVNWYGEEVRLLVRDVGMQGLVAIGHQIEAHAKANLPGPSQVDTGFMRNSIYVSAPNEDSFGETWSTGLYKSKKTGQMVRRTRGQKIAPPNQETVVVAVGAEYAIFQELRESFLLKAVEQVQGDVAEAEIETVARRRGLRG